MAERKNPKLEMRDLDEWTPEDEYYYRKAQDQRGAGLVLEEGSLEALAYIRHLRQAGFFGNSVRNVGPNAPDQPTEEVTEQVNT